MDFTAPSSDFEIQLRKTVEDARQALLHQKGDDPFWNFGAHLGPHFLSQYFLMLNWLKRDLSKFDVTKHRATLAKLQLNDGSWHQVEDSSLVSGDLNATIFNYWALKAMGERPDGERLTRARTFIHSQGGIAKSALFTKTFLSLFGNYDWKQLTYIPYIAFVDGLPSNYKSFSQWVIPHLMPMAYLRHVRANRDLGPNFKVDELWISAPPAVDRGERKPRSFHDRPLIEKMLSHQQPRGSWGGYTVSTLLTIASLSHYRENAKAGALEEKISQAILRGYDFVDWLYLEPGPASYQGALMDGRYWDSLLVANSLLESAQENAADLENVANDVAALQQRGGGYPYGIDFEYAPDVDDTAEAVLFLSHWPKFKEANAKSVEWLRSMQNDDGGWGAFDKNNVGNPLLRTLAARYSDSVDLFDDSSADSTGHVLDALSVGGLNVSNCEESRRGVRYLKGTQLDSGVWVGRWAINYLFGTTCALVGLLKAGESATSEVVQKAFTWLESKQNVDGGFGESTQSYLLMDWAGRGPSTPSQTAWVLWALVAGGRHESLIARKAAEYLVKTMSPTEKTWKDTSVTGTGHPGLLYMNYPSYARAFPLIALAQYLKTLASAKAKN